MTTATKNRLTPEDLLLIPKDGKKYELVDGEIKMSPAGMRHEEVTSRLIELLKDFLKSCPLGKVYASSVGFILPNGNLRSPDVSFVRSENLPGGKSPAGFGKMIPDLVIEVLSPGDVPRDVADKIGDYLGAGVPVVWLADPASESVTVYRSLTETAVFHSEQSLSAEPVLPGFTCRVAAIFE